MKMKKKVLKIGELAHKIKIETFVIRFWEREFQIRVKRSRGGQRYYTAKDIEQFTLIKDLLYKKGYTIIGAKKYLESVKESRRRKFTTANPDNTLPKYVIQLLTKLSQDLKTIKKEI